MATAELQERMDMGASMVEEIRRTAERRLRQIEPLVEEAERLRDVLRALDGRLTGTRSLRSTANGSRRNQTHATPGRRARSRGERTESASGESVPTRAAKGANKRVIIELVAQRPGITSAQIAESTGMKRTVVASTVSRLKRYGELSDHEQGGLCLRSPEASGQASPELSGEHPRRLSALPRRRAA